MTYYTMNDLEGIELRESLEDLNKFRPSGRDLKMARKTLGLRRADLAHILGTSERAVEMDENHKEPKTDTEKILVALLRFALLQWEKKNQ
jgi:DNA-binding transcriptional regulator YiaG